MKDDAAAMSPPAAKPAKEGGWKETLKTLVIALTAAMCIRTVLFEPFNIPSGSMIPTLLVGDYLFVSKYSYGYSQHSTPFSAIPIQGRLFAKEPKRGDVIVFKQPIDNKTDYIKRLIGLPGDRIQMQGGRLIINGDEVPRERIGEYIYRNSVGVAVRTTEYWETLPGGVKHRILEISDNNYLDNTGVYVVPPGHYFMMGDNRDDSQDSRVPSVVGFVPFENLVGRADRMFLSVDGSLWRFWEWPSSLRFSRMFRAVE